MRMKKPGQHTLPHVRVSLVRGVLLLTLSWALPASAVLACNDSNPEPVSCVRSSCKGVAYCEGTQYGECIPTGESTLSCEVCGRTGYMQCSEFTVIPGSCTAYRSEICNQCDDDGNGEVDEGLTGNPCTLPNGCSGITACSPSGSICVWFEDSSKPCEGCGEGGRAPCRQDGSLGPCQPVVASREIPCNGCDDDRDGVGDGGPWVTEVCNGLDDNCDGRIDEGPNLVEGEVCQVSLACACQPATCAALGKNCGSVPDGCGGTLSCGTCSAPQSCGGGGTPNVCGCTPTTCAAQGAQCGTLADGCGGTLSCGTCSAPQSCGGGGTPNVCGCTPTTCAAQGVQCGSLFDGCGGTLSCGTCSHGFVCRDGLCEPKSCSVNCPPEP
jgi:hypothetical protein